jgi:hypothetical protein
MSEPMNANSDLKHEIGGIYFFIFIGNQQVDSPPSFLK